MFKHLTNFSYKRNWKEALGFYLAYLLLGMLFGAVSGVLFGIGSEQRSFNDGFEYGLIVGAVVAILYSLSMCVLVLLQRRLYYSFGYILLVPVAGIAAAFGGGFLGLIIPTIMTTRGNSNVEPTQTGRRTQKK